MNDLLKQMAQDAGSTAQDNMGKIGAVANDVADTDKEISDLEDQLKRKKIIKNIYQKMYYLTYFQKLGYQN